MTIENLAFSSSGGFLFGAVAGYAIKKVMKIATFIIGLIVVGLSYLSYRGWIGVKWGGNGESYEKCGRTSRLRT